MRTYAERMADLDAAFTALEKQRQSHMAWLEQANQQLIRLQGQYALLEELEKESKGNGEEEQLGQTEGEHADGE